MEDTKSLLIMVLHKVFENQPKIIEDTFQLIHNFNNGKIERKNYEKILKSVCDLMNDELPSPILFYILTLVDMPQDFGTQSPIIEKMRKTHDFLPEVNVRSHLVDYLNNMKPVNNINLQHNCENRNWITTRNDKVITKPGLYCSSNCFMKPPKVIKRTRKLLRKPLNMSPLRLVDICAMHIVKQETTLKEIYENLLKRTWNRINNNTSLGVKLNDCYSLLKDLNKKMKLLREIETNNISLQLLSEEYITSDIFLKENHIFHEMNRDPFRLSEECEMLVINRCKH